MGLLGSVAHGCRNPTFAMLSLSSIEETAGLGVSLGTELCQVGGRVIQVM